MSNKKQDKRLGPWMYIKILALAAFLGINHSSTHAIGRLTGRGAKNTSSSSVCCYI